MRLYVSIYGDGALLDARKNSHLDLRRDNEENDGIKGETAILELEGVPDDIAERALDYVNGNSGPHPYRDGYEAMQCVQAATSSTVLECSVNRPDGWTAAECKRLGGCYLCGGMHE